MKLFPPFERTRFAYLLAVLSHVRDVVDHPAAEEVRRAAQESCRRLVAHAEAHNLEGVFVENYVESFNKRQIGISRPEFYALLAETLASGNTTELAALVEDSYRSQLGSSETRRAALEFVLLRYGNLTSGEREELGPEEGASDGFTPTGEDHRKTSFGAIRRRRGQEKFRDALRRRFKDRCVVTGCDLVDVLEAAHIAPYRGEKDNDERNGLLLRADIHTLFDLELIGIEPEQLIVHVHPDARTAPYVELHGRPLEVDAASRPSRAALQFRWETFQKATC